MPRLPSNERWLRFVAKPLVFLACLTPFVLLLHLSLIHI